MPDELYERDALAWAERQAGLLRRLAAGELLNEPVDWAHVIEEVADVGLSELRACQSLLVQALAHLLKLRAWPGSQAGARWQGEAAAFLAGARRSLSPLRCGKGSTWGSCMRMRCMACRQGPTMRARRAPCRTRARSGWTS